MLLLKAVANQTRATKQVLFQFKASFGTRVTNYKRSNTPSEPYLPELNNGPGLGHKGPLKIMDESTPSAWPTLDSILSSTGSCPS